MWTVIKYYPKKLHQMQTEISKKFHGDTEYYSPKILIEYYLKNKLSSKKINLLGDYIFCFNKNFKSKNSVNQIKFTRGLKYILNGYSYFQEDITKFIITCKNNEKIDGCVSLDFIDLTLNAKYKFNSGPFTGKIFELINFQKNKLNILLGKIKTTTDKKEFLFSPV